MERHIGYAASTQDYVTHNQLQPTAARQRQPSNATAGSTQHFSKPRLSATSSGLPLRDYQPPADSFRAPPKPQGSSPLKSSPSGELVQDFKFPQAPAASALRPARSREFLPPRSKARVSHAASSQYSPITEVTTPSSAASLSFQARPVDSPSSAYPDTIAEETPFEVQHHNGEPHSATDGFRQGQGVVRQASLGRKATPQLTTIRGSDQQAHANANNPVTPTSPISRAATMEALSAAIAAGLTTDRRGSPEVTALPNMPGHPRMPFDTTPPHGATYEYDYGRQRALTTSSGRTPSSAVSARSGNPLLGLGIDETSLSGESGGKSKKRPPRLNMDVVREAEARGSTTSLADLIRRATRLASNLDRGKTASKLNMLDAYNSHEKLDRTRRRESDMSDMLSAFPPPAAGYKGSSTGWTEKGTNYTATEVSPSEKAKPRRKCCGMSLRLFFFLLVVLILIVAAAVLVPVFLVLVPREHSNVVDVAHCKTTHPCSNGGSTVVVNNQCSCVCVGGFTGSGCGQLDTTCITAPVTGASETYDNATMGTSMMPLLSGTANTFNVPINSTSLLAMFASGNLTCESENSLVTFNTHLRNKRSRLLPRHNVNHALPSAVVAPRQASSDGIVFATSSAAPTQATYVASVSTGAAPTSTTLLAATPTPTHASNVTTQQMNFAEVIVLYVLQQTTSLSTAVNANQNLDEYLSGTQQNATVDVGYAGFPITANFKTFEIETESGTVGGLRTQDLFVSR